MRSSKDKEVGFRLSVVMMAMSMLVSCQDSTGPDWEYAGIRHVRVVQLNVAETITSGDTLTIVVIGDTQPMGRLSLDRIDVVREKMEIDSLGKSRKVGRVRGHATTTIRPYDQVYLSGSAAVQ